MEKFLALANIKNFKQKLEQCTDSAKGLMLHRLLTAEEARLAELEARQSGEPSNS